jgi:hypothetical protein
MFFLLGAVRMTRKRRMSKKWPKKEDKSHSKAISKILRVRMLIYNRFSKW